MKKNRICRMAGLKGLVEGGAGTARASGAEGSGIALAGVRGGSQRRGVVAEIVVHPMRKG